MFNILITLLTFDFFFLIQSLNERTIVTLFFTTLVLIIAYSY